MVTDHRVLFPVRSRLNTRDHKEDTHYAVWSLSPDIKICDPHKIISLPFPSPLEIPERFRLAKPKGDVAVFQLIGRSIFPNLLEEVQNPDFLLNRHRGQENLITGGPCLPSRPEQEAGYLYPPSPRLGCP